MMTIDEIKEMILKAVDSHRMVVTSEDSDRWRAVISLGLNLLATTAAQNAEHAAVVAVTSKGTGHA